MNTRLILSVVAALLVGVAAGFGLGQAMTPKPEAVPDLVVVPSENAGPVPTASGDQPPLDPKSEVHPPRTTPAPVSPATGTTDMQHQPPVGDGVVTARFVDIDGRGVSGIPARLAFDIGASRPRPPRAEDFVSDPAGYKDTMLQFYEHLLRLQADATQVQVSDADGRLEFRGVPDGNSGFLCRPEGYLVVPAALSLARTVKPGDHIEVVLVRAVAITVRLDMPAPEPDTRAPHCQLRWTPKGSNGVAGNRQVKPNEEAKVWLVPGEYTLRVSIEGQPGSAISVVITDPPTTQVFVFGPNANTGLTGTVTFDGGRPRGCVVSVAAVQPGLTDVELFSGSAGLAISNAPLDHATGRFYWLPPQAGEYAIRLMANGQTVEVRRVWLSTEEIHEVNFRLSPPAGPHLRVRLELPPRHVIRNPELSIQGISTDTWIVSDTEYLLYYRESGRDLPAQALLLAEPAGLGSRQLSFKPGVDHELTVVFQEPGELAVRIQGGPTGMNVLRVRAIEVPQLVVAAETHVSRDHESNWRIPQALQLQPGRYRIMALVAQSSGPLLVSEELTISSGNSQFSLTIPELHSVKLDAGEVNLVGIVSIEQLPSGHKFPILLGNDRTTVLTLPAGACRLHYRSQSNSNAESTLDFNVPSSGAIVITR